MFVNIGPQGQDGQDSIGYDNVPAAAIRPRVLFTVESSANCMTHSVRFSVNGVLIEASRVKVRKLSKLDASCTRIARI